MIGTIYFAAGNWNVNNWQMFFLDRATWHVTTNGIFFNVKDGYNLFSFVWISCKKTFYRVESLSCYSPILCYALEFTVKVNSPSLWRKINSDYFI